MRKWRHSIAPYYEQGLFKPWWCLLRRRHGQVPKSKPFNRLHGQVQLILTSPPYPLNKKKSYGNLTGEAYVEWIESLAPLFSDLLTGDGSLVIELGNSWEPERPVQSLLALKALMALATAKGTGLRLIQQFICHNPSRLPSPAAWVTVRHLRAVDSFTHVWWLANRLPQG